MADQQLNRRIGRGRVTLLRAGGLQPAKFGSFEQFWSAVWRALLEPAACHLVEHKRASDNALQTTRCRRGSWRFHTGLRRVERAITMQITNFKNMYIAELQELVSMEGQLADELPRMAEVASHPSLKNILMHHREETQVQRERLESILQKHGANPRAHTDQAMQALVNETEMMLGMLNGNELRDAGLIASAQKLEHYEIAAYGTVAALAGQLDLRDDQQMLHESLEEEKQADVRLTKLAKREVNPDALAA
jgi:ferritin-like metal-binding protein YciE